MCGNVDIDDVMFAIQKIEDKIRSKPKQGTWTRPWKKIVPPLTTKIINNTVAANIDGFAEVYIAWRTPDTVTTFRKYLALTFLVPYLSSTLSARDFNAKSIATNVDYTMFFKFVNVPVDKLNLVYPTLQDRLKNVANGKSKMNRNYSLSSNNRKKGMVTERFYRILSSCSLSRINTSYVMRTTY